jgi:hypothetical protein
MTTSFVRFIAFATLLLFMLGCDSDNSTYVRVRNNTDKDFSNVTINDNKFGDIKSGEASEYQILAMAYPDPYLGLSVGTNQLKSAPAQYQGEQALGPGRFSYVVDIKEQQLNIHSQKDK